MVREGARRETDEIIDVLVQCEREATAIVLEHLIHIPLESIHWGRLIQVEVRRISRYSVVNTGNGVPLLKRQDQ